MPRVASGRRRDSRSPRRPERHAVRAGRAHGEPRIRRQLHGTAWSVRGAEGKRDAPARAGGRPRRAAGRTRRRHGSRGRARAAWRAGSGGSPPPGRRRALEVSLQGRGVAVTRPRSLAKGLAGLIEKAGGTPFLFPAIEIEPLAPARPPAAADFAIFISPTAVREGLKYLQGRPRIVALSRGTRRELERGGVTGAIAAEEGADSEALLAVPELRDV